jgi:hypothetical protein
MLQQTTLEGMLEPMLQAELHKVCLHRRSYLVYTDLLTNLVSKYKSSRLCITRQFIQSNTFNKVSCYKQTLSSEIIFPTEFILQIE